jgi:polysaccharide export outer membrane protein
MEPMETRPPLRRAIWLALALVTFPVTASGQQSDSVLAPTDGLHPGDIVSVEIWREPDLSGQYQVAANGQIILPMLGIIGVVGKSAEAIAADITTGYSKYLVNPSIQVTVLRRVSVQGNIRNPGLYPVDATVTMADLLAMAGGLTSNADPKKIRLVRNGSVLDVALSPEMIIESSPVRSGDQVFVGERSWLARNSGIIIGTSITAAAVIISALVLR